MPKLIQGHKYLLLVSHYTNTQSGYSLTFGGGTAVITDPKLPDLQSASTGCNKALVKIVLNKGMRCNSLAADGSDFKVASNPVSVIGAIGYGCNSQFDMDSIQLVSERLLVSRILIPSFQKQVPMEIPCLMIAVIS